MQKITPHLWFDKEAREAAEFYVSLIPNSKITHVSTIHNTPSGDCDTVSFELAGQPFMAISAGPVFTFNPSISFTISCETEEEVDALWRKLIVGGKALMEIGEYPFSTRYEWLSDRYGLSWQIVCAGSGVPSQKITPSLLFTGEGVGHAEEAITFYTSLFKDSKIEHLVRYENQPPEKDGTVAHALFTLQGREFTALESAQSHAFSFNEAVSLLIPCETQEEIDFLWEKLSAVPAAEQCGWCKDTYGVSWQVWPTIMGEIMASGDQEKIERVTQAFLKMKKFDISALLKAADAH